MSTKTGIEWTGDTWNPVTGCDRVSEGCDHCYALTLAKRLKAMGNLRYQRDGDPRTSGPGFGVSLHPDKLGEPLTLRRPRPIFVNSMSDLFHDEVPDEFIAEVFDTMGAAQEHVFQILTKRPGRMASLLNRWTRGQETIEQGGLLPYSPLPIGTVARPGKSPWPLPNVWLGTSVENQRWANVRIPKLLETPAAVRFLSCEPLLGPVDLSRWLRGSATLHDTGGGATEGEPPSPREVDRASIDWVIVGGESGPGFRPLDLEWVRSLRDQCAVAEAAFFFKQVGGRTPKAGGRELDGREWRDLPAGTPPAIVEGLKRRKRLAG